jgi:hypothetical protein
LPCACIVSYPAGNRPRNDRVKELRAPRQDLPRDAGERSTIGVVGDVVFLLIIGLSFAVLYAFVGLCDRIIGADEEEPTATDHAAAEQVAA